MSRRVCVCVRGGGARGGGPNLLPMLKLRIDKRTLYSVVRISVNATLFAVLSEKLSLFVALPVLTTLYNKCFFFHYDLTKRLFYKWWIFPTLNDDSAAHCPALENTFSSYYCSSIGTK